jgi:hypothetical protein
MNQLNTEWFLPSRVDDHPLAWMVMVNGFIVDIRSMPREVQEIAYAQGVIPYIPGEKPGKQVIEEPESPLAQANISQTSPDSLFVLEVYLISGLITEEFVEENPVVARTIEITGAHTLEDLHKIVFKAFDRFDSHLYEFQIGGDQPNDPKARRYGLKQAYAAPMFGEEIPKGDVATTKMSELGLAIDDVFGYWFDFGDDWWHQVNVVAITEKAAKTKYPRITSRIGASPPQYPDFD